MTPEEEFYSLIDRLQVCSEINHPDRPWSPAGKASIEESWSGKESELKNRVEMLEEKLKSKI